MNVADAVTALGAGGLFSSGFSLIELMLAGIMGLFFAGSLALCIMTMRAANAARAVRGEAQGALATIRAQAAEFKALAGDLERAGADLAASHAELKDLQAVVQKTLAVQASATPETEAAPQAVERRLDPLPPGGHEPPGGHDLSVEPEKALMETEAPERPVKSSLMRGLLRRR